MDGLVRRQGAYAQNKQTVSEMKATANKLAKSSFLGRDPSGERPIPDSLWEGHDLSEQGALLKDVQETVWNYLRVHLTRILHKHVHARVQAQEDMYTAFPAMKDGVHNGRMPWSEYKTIITYLLAPQRYGNVCFGQGTHPAARGGRKRSVLEQPDAQGAHTR